MFRVHGINVNVINEVNYQWVYALFNRFKDSVEQ